MAISNIIDVSDSSIESPPTLVLGSSSYFDLSGGDVSAGPSASSTLTAVPSAGPVSSSSLSTTPTTVFGPYFDHVLEVRVPGIKGKQIATGSDGIATANLVDGVLSADVSGRAKFAAGFFDSATVTAKFAAGAIALDRLSEAVLQADGGQAWTGNHDAGGNKLTNLAEPTQDGDAATKAYADAIATGLDLKASVRLATAAALPANTPAGSGVGKTLTGDANGALTVDGVAVVVGNRILVKNEGGGTSAHNGIYVVTATGDGSNPFVLTRATDADGTPSNEVTPGMFTFVEEGTANADSGWAVVTDGAITVDTTAVAFTQFSGAGQVVAGAGLTKTGNTLDVGQGAGIVVGADDIAVDFALVGVLSTVNAGDAAAAGTEDTAARGDHQHAVSTAAPGTTIKSDAAAAAEGVATSLMRSDAQIVAQTATPATTVKSDAAAASQGTSQSLLRADAQLTAATAAPSAASVQSDAAAVSQGSSQNLLRADAGFTAATAAPSNVGTSNQQGTSTSLSRADHIHASPKPTSLNKGENPSATAAAAAQDTGLTIGAAPALGGYVYVTVNGAIYEVAKDDTERTTRDFYYSGDNGATARSLASIVANDKLYFNGDVAGFALAATDRVSQFYETF